MDEQHKQPEENQSGSVYTPRPAYQVWAARIGVVVVIIAVLLYLYKIATGGM